MQFIPNTSLEKQMLKTINTDKIEDLFSDIPSTMRLKKLSLPDGISQMEIEKKLQKIADNNKSCKQYLSFIGGGIKPHYVPAVVKAITHRPEFYTAYTPYQSEASQGFLQAMFEFQSMIAEITGMDIANCSLYDGSTALAEAMLMCSRIKRKKNTFIIPSNISWEKKSVLHNYAKGTNITIKEIPYHPKTGCLDIDQLQKETDETVCGVYIENPNFFGILEENVSTIEQTVHNAQSLFVVGVDPLSLGLIKKPESYDADIVIGEGRALGNAMDYGGSGLGLFACKKPFLRQIPGRLIGKTKDSKGNKAFCMTMQTREQHIRRGRATSNICTNEGLCALAAAVYLSWLGGNGLQELSNTNFENCQHFIQTITSIDGFETEFTGVSFNECVIHTPVQPSKINSYLLKKGIHGGLILDNKYSDMKHTMLFGVAETHSKEDIMLLADTIKEVSHV